MKVKDIIKIVQLYNQIKDKKMPIRTAYKLNKLNAAAEKEMEFVQASMKKVIDSYGIIENGQYKMSEDGQSILIQPDKVVDCQNEIASLENTEVNIEAPHFKIEELENLDITIQELDCIIDLIEE